MYGTLTNSVTDTENDDFWELLEVCRNSKDDDIRLSVKRNLFHVKNNYCVGIKHHDNHKSRYFKPMIINRKTCSNHSNFRDKKEVCNENNKD